MKCLNFLFSFFENLNFPFLTNADIFILIPSSIKSIPHMHEITKNVVISSQMLFKFIQFMFLELKGNFFYIVFKQFNNLITNLSLFIDNSRKLI